ncbi:hypothetical protein [Hydrogenimonas sp.]
MRTWAPLLLSLLFLAGCSAPEEAPKEKVRFSVLVPKAAEAQTTRFVERVKVVTSTLPRSRVSAMVVNNPIRADREAVIAVAIENRSGETLTLAWDDIVFFHPKNAITMLPPERICDYFEEPGHSKPVLGSKLFKEQMLAMGALSDEPTPARALPPTEERLAYIYHNIKKDLCFVKLPHDKSLAPGEVAAGFLVIVLPKKHFLHEALFMLKIPVDGDLHKLRYALKPIQ